MNTKKSIIRVESLCASYGEELVLDDISFEVYPGEIFAILGGSGCGKSTLLKHMIGLLRPDSGNIYIDGNDIASATGRKRKEILQNIGVTFQNGALFKSMTLLDNITLPLEMFTELPRPARELIAAMKLDLVGLRPYCNHLPDELSGGMQKRAAIARAMVMDPKILFLDEPSAGLDPITSADLDHLILNLSKSLNITFVLVTHELPSVFATADRVLMLEKQVKKAVAIGTPQQLRDDRSNPWVWQFFHRHSVDKPQDTETGMDTKKPQQYNAE